MRFVGDAHMPMLMPTHANDSRSVALIHLQLAMPQWLVQSLVFFRAT